MDFSTTFFGYMKWHYGKALFTTFSFWTNILVFLFNYFSLKKLSHEFFSPWKKLSGNYPSFVVLITNNLLRVIGIILRLIIMIVGIIVSLIYIILLPASLVVWIVLPIFVILLILAGLILMIFS